MATVPRPTDPSPLQVLADRSEAEVMRRFRRQRDLCAALGDAIRRAEAVWRLEAALRDLSV